MKFVVQRSLQASVMIENRLVGAIEKGYVVLVGVEDADTEKTADAMLKKLWNLRIFADEEGKTNLSLRDVDGELLIISQFTLYADCHKGNRPSFIKSGSPAHAKALYEYILARCREEEIPTASGEFGADMKVSLINDGPFTVVLDSVELFGGI